MKLIPLTQGQFAKIDDADFPSVSQFQWQAHRTGKNRSWRAKRGLYDPAIKNNRNEYLHQFLTGCRVDHHDGDGLNNQRFNLRPCSTRQNNQAYRKKSLGKSSRYRGVLWNRQAGKWQGRITVENRQYHLGYFKEEILAAHAYDAASKKFFGEFAAPNFKL